VNPACRPPVYLPKPEPHPPAVKPGTYRASGLVYAREGVPHAGWKSLSELATAP